MPCAQRLVNRKKNEENLSGFGKINLKEIVMTARAAWWHLRVGIPEGAAPSLISTQLMSHQGLGFPAGTGETTPGLEQILCSHLRAAASPSLFLITRRDATGHCSLGFFPFPIKLRVLTSHLSAEASSPTALCSPRVTAAQLRHCFLLIRLSF